MIRFLRKILNSSMGKWWVWAKNLKMEKPKFPNLLILEHLINHFIEPSE